VRELELRELEVTATLLELLLDVMLILLELRELEVIALLELGVTIALLELRELEVTARLLELREVETALELVRGTVAKASATP